MNQAKLSESGYQTRVWKGNIRLVFWNGLWVAATAVMAFGPKYFWDEASVFTLLAVGLNLVAGVGLIVANKRYVEGLDELQQKVWFNALAITAGVALIASPFEVMDQYGVIPFHAQISHLVMLMALTFVVAIAYGNWRYR